MKKIILFLYIFAFSIFLSAQEERPILIKGYFNDDYRRVELSSEVYKYLFIKEQSQINMYERRQCGYFVDLDSLSAEKLKRDYIFLIFTDNNTKPSSYSDKEFVAEILPLNLKYNTNVYYTKGMHYTSEEENRKNDYLYNFWSDPLANDTLINFAGSLSPQEWDYRYTPLLINALNIKDSIQIEHISYNRTSTDCVPYFYYISLNIAETARKSLENSNMQYLDFDNLKYPPEGSSKAVWQKWHDDLPKQLELIDPVGDFHHWTTTPQLSVYDDVIFQRNDSIYGYWNDSVFILNTKEEKMYRLPYDEAPPFSNIRKNWADPEREENVTVDKVYRILDRSAYGGQWRKVLSANGDIIVVTYKDTNFQRIFSIHKILKGSNKLSKGLVFQSTMPIDDYNSFQRMKVVDLFETPDKYIVITRRGLNRYWYMIEKSLVL